MAQFFKCLESTTETLSCEHKRLKKKNASKSHKYTFCFVFSNLDFSFLPLLPVQPVTNSEPSKKKRHFTVYFLLQFNIFTYSYLLKLYTYSPREVSAVNECLVPLLDSNTNPGKSSFNIVAC